MILVYLVGGLGNQLFQYAAGRALAEHHGVPLKLDKTYYDLKKYEGDTLNQYYNISSFRDILNIFKTTASEATKEEAKKFRPRLLRKIVDRLKPHHLRTVYKQPTPDFDENFFKIGKNVLLKSIFQSEKYFLQYSEVIRKELSFQEVVINSNTDMASLIKKELSVSLHIRRGDYVSHAITSEVLGVLDLDYYYNAMDFIEKKTGKNVTYFIFSDDSEWVKKNFKTDKKMVYVNLNSTTRDIDEFYLMSCCNHNIIANSSYSWWAGWLNSNKEKLVIAPARWFKDPAHNNKDLIPLNWIRI